MRPDEIPRRKQHVQIAVLADGRALVRHDQGHTLRVPVDPEDLAVLLDAVDGRRSAAEIATLLADRFETDDVFRVLANLQGDVLEIVAEAASPLPSSEVLLIGNGAVANGLATSLQSTGMARVRQWSPPLPVSEASAPLCGQGKLLPPETVPGHLLEQCRLVVCALEGYPAAYAFAAQDTCFAKNVPVLFVEQSAGKTRIGPLVLPGSTACLACAWLQTCEPLALPPRDLLAALASFTSAPMANLPQVLTHSLAEIRAVVTGSSEAALFDRLIAIDREGVRRETILTRHAACPLCATHEPPAHGSPPALAGRAETAVVRRQNRRASIGHSKETRRVVRRVGILGGGTAGYLTALALRAKQPQLEVTLIESSKVPVIGVGEATTPLMAQFLHVDLGLDIHEFFETVAPTFKLGIRFFWGQPGEAWFNYPFGPNRVLESLAHEDRLSEASLHSMMMDAGVLPMETGHCSLGTEVAYHLDNRRFVAYLADQAKRRGVQVRDLVIAEVCTDASGQRIETLVDEGGTAHSFDFFVDCSGFRSLLMEGALGSAFEPYDRSLFTDRALIASVPNSGPIMPYTLAETMAAGWCWNTPQREADHLGYVFSSRWLSSEDAEREMRLHHPGMGDAKLIVFRAGRHRHFWKGNVAAMGNAYGFVEPLESTALHLLIRQIGLLVRSFPITGDDPGLATALNRKVNAWWDYLAWFLALHYKFNHKLDTPFWKACRRDVDISAFEELVHLYRHRGPLSADRAARTVFDYPDPLWGAVGIDVILAGQGERGYLPQPAMTRQAWEQWRRRAQRWVQGQLPQREALAALSSQPELLDQFLTRYQAVGSAF